MTDLDPIGFGEVLDRLSANIQAIDGMQMEAKSDDTVETLVDTYDAKLPHPGIAQSRVILVNFAEEVVKRRDEFYRSEGLSQ